MARLFFPSSPLFFLFFFKARNDRAADATRRSAISPRGRLVDSLFFLFLFYRRAVLAEGPHWWSAMKVARWRCFFPEFLPSPLFFRALDHPTGRISTDLESERDINIVELRRAFGLFSSPFPAGVSKNVNRADCAWNSLFSVPSVFPFFPPSLPFFPTTHLSKRLRRAG